MSLETSIWEAELHRETYVAILNSVLKERGSKRALAEKVGITPQYLSYILVTDKDPDNQRVIKRTPSEELCERIANALELRPEQRAVLIEEMLLSRQHLHEAVETMLPLVSQREASWERVHRLASEAYHAEEPEVYRQRCQGLRVFLVNLLHQLDAWHNPLLYAMAALSICGAENDVGRPGRSLYYAKLARFVIEYMAVDNPRLDKQRVDEIWIESILAESTAAMNLKLFKEGYDCCQAVEALGIATPYPAFKMHLISRTLKALTGIPRYSIREAQRLVQAAERLCDQHAGLEAGLPLYLHNIQRGLTEVYIQRGQYRKAERLLYGKVEPFQEVLDSPLRHVQLLKVQARLSWHQGDHQGWQHLVQSAVTIAREASLTDQLNKLEADYGSALATEVT